MVMQSQLKQKPGRKPRPEKTCQRKEGWPVTGQKLEATTALVVAVNVTLRDVVEGTNGRWADWVYFERLVPENSGIKIEREGTAEGRVNYWNHRETCENVILVDLL